jgi:small subunit ribosomal protein S9
MQDDTQNENATPDEPTPDEGDAPAGDEPAAPAEPPAEDEAPAEEQAPADDEQPAEGEAPAPAEEAPAVEQAEPADAPAPEEGGEEAAAAPAAGKQGKGDAEEAAPGADLEPIRLEEERELSAEERARLEAEQEEQERRQAEAEADGGDEPVREGATLDLAADAKIQATGKRKTSVARVVIARGGGAFKVNDRALDEYFPRSYHQTVARQALATSGYEGQVDVSVRVHGGGISGQADAVRHGVARALVEIDSELRGELKRRGMLTRDARAKERRKAGLKKARKRPQFSKR